MQIKVIFDKPRQQVWVLRLIRQGEKYGQGSAIPHKDADPLVEFFDPRHPHTDLGQFVSRYYASTLLTRNPQDGILLDTGSEYWVLSKEGRSLVTDWLKSLGLDVAKTV